MRNLILESLPGTKYGVGFGAGCQYAELMEGYADPFD